MLLNDAVDSVVRPDTDHRGFLFAERLNCIASQNFRRQINLENFNTRDLWHKTTLAMESRSIFDIVVSDSGQSSEFITSDRRILVTERRSYFSLCNRTPDKSCHRTPQPDHNVHD
jgi:hypothetical protein